jgi:hypothetical protein
LITAINIALAMPPNMPITVVSTISRGEYRNKKRINFITDALSG